MDDKRNISDNEQNEKISSTGSGMDIFATFSAAPPSGGKPEEKKEAEPSGSPSAEPAKSADLPSAGGTPYGTTQSFVPVSSGEAPEDAAEPVSVPSKAKLSRRAKKAVEASVEEGAPEKFSKRLFRYLGNLFLTCCCLMVIIGSFVVVLMSMYMVNITAEDGDLLSENELELGYTTIIYAIDDTVESDTTVYYEAQRLYGSQNRIWVDYEDIPESIIEAVVAIEDQKFWRHDGIDWKRTAAAFINAYVVPLWSSTQGGSTITQQLIKNITSDKATDSISGAFRKMREIYRAMVVENNHSKEEILEAYLNTISFSGQIAGIESAANAYFNCHASELSIAQACAIVVVTNNPTKYNPLVHPDENKFRREYGISEMYSQGKITEEEYNAAMEESANMVYVNSVDENGEYIIPRDELISNTQRVYSYFTDMVIDDAIADLADQLEISKSAASSKLFNGGLRVYTTMTRSCQEAYEELILDSMWPTVVNKHGQREQAAQITMNAKGEILGLMGGIGQKTISRGLNRAVGTTRSIGSSMKPIGTYGPAIEVNAIHYSTLFVDEPVYVAINNVMQWYPKNYGNYRYSAAQTVQRAVEQSINTIAVRTLHLIGFNYSYSFLENRLGISSLQGYYDKNESSLALGGLNIGISLKELCAAYVPFINGGTYYEPHSYTKITDSSGRTIVNKNQIIRQVKAFSPDTAMIMNKILQTVITNGTGTSFRYSGMTLGGKSGTNSRNYDFIFVGFNPYYVTANWMGFDTATPLSNSVKINTRLGCKYVMQKISALVPYKEYPVASNVVRLTHCRESGCIATSICTSTRVGYYKNGNIPEYCDGSLHTSVSLDSTLPE